MGKPRISYSPHPAATTDDELTALAAIYAFVIKSSEAMKKAGGNDAGEDDARKVKDACTAEKKYTRT
jgi:hypothetical protein